MYSQKEARPRTNRPALRSSSPAWVPRCADSRNRPVTIARLKASQNVARRTWATHWTTGIGLPHSNGKNAGAERTSAGAPDTRPSRRGRILVRCLLPNTSDRLPILTAGTSPSSPTWTTARPRWSTRCSRNRGRIAPTSGWPIAPWTPWTSSASAASPSWPRTRPCGTSTPSSTSATRRATPTSAARWSARCRWSTASCCWWTRRKAPCPRRGSCSARPSSAASSRSSSSTRWTGRTRACRRCSTRSTTCSSTSTPTRISSNFPVIYAVARDGKASLDPNVRGEDLRPLFDAIIEHTPPPKGDPEGVLQILIANLDASEYLGRIAIGRIFNGRVQDRRLRRHLQAGWLGPADARHQAVRLRRPEARRRRRKRPPATSSASPAWRTSPSARR